MLPRGLEDIMAHRPDAVTRSDGQFVVKEILRAPMYSLRHIRVYTTHDLSRQTQQHSHSNPHASQSPATATTIRTEHPHPLTLSPLNRTKYSSIPTSMCDGWTETYHCPECQTEWSVQIFRGRLCRPNVCRSPGGEIVWMGEAVCGRCAARRRRRGRRRRAAGGR